MQIPARLEQTLRPEAATGLLAAAGVETLTFLATPLLVPGLAERYDISAATAGLVATAQVGSFLIATLVAGRMLRPTARLVRLSLSLMVIAAVGSAYAPTFAVLLCFGAAAGLGMGCITWAAWVVSIGRDRHLSDVAAAGPLATMIGTPILGMLAYSSGTTGLYLALAAAGLAALALPLELPSHVEVPPPTEGNPLDRRSRRSLSGLGLLMIANSAVWVQMSTIGTGRMGMSAASVGLLMAANAAAGLIGARADTSLLRPATWLAVTGPTISILLIAPHAIVFGAAVIIWGFLFQAAVPHILNQVARTSSDPAAALGEAQSAMAGGRTLGPLAGGAVLAQPMVAAMIAPALFMAASRLTAGTAKTATSDAATTH